SPPVPLAENLGIFNSGTSPSSVFVVEFDPYANDHWDPNFRHVGIDLGSRVSSNTTEVGGSITGQQVGWRTEKKILDRGCDCPNQLRGSHEDDHRSYHCRHEEVGLSASTGDNVATHDIVSWDFSATMVNMKKNMDVMIRQYV
ncbi:agglutinin-2-like, partial [Salvia miltiorrhiza]|uniref:agglutinin-2-like n=1 Tax=Salvia miltiorrhiza TaxID=226208 RepID=UPI0025AD8FCF